MNNDSVVLNIGCGDGFYDSLFYSEVAKHIDAVDIDKSAIRFALNNNSSEKIQFHELDIIGNELPKKSYNVVVMDGSIGHFNFEEISNILLKVKNALSHTGIFVGSEEISTEDEMPYDHFQAFPSLLHLKKLLKNYFTFVQVKEISPIKGRYREGYFRCSANSSILDKYSWK
jgi:SAM-dependent methyltransferase